MKRSTGDKSMKRSIWQLGVLLLALGAAQGGFAASTQTSAGTTVTNTATVNYTVNTIAQAPAVSPVNSFVVDTKVDLSVTWLDAGNVAVVPGSTQEVLRYSITNTGNATQGVLLTIAGLVGDDFDMTFVGIYVDSNGNGNYDSGTDVLYSSGANAGNLNPYDTTDSITVFLVANTPNGGSSPTDGQLASYVLTAQATNAGTNTVTTESATNTAGGTPDVIFADGAGVTDAVEDGRHSVTGTYEVVTAELVVTKTSAVIDDGLDGPVEFAVPGATIRYTISIANNGTSDAFIPDDGVVNTTDGLSDDINDALVAYVTNSVVVDSVAISDNTTGTVNTDTVRVTISNANGTPTALDRIQVNGLTVAAGATVAITFDVTIL